nr:hypothetical protein [Tanacetum cinerariifolium]
MATEPNDARLQILIKLEEFDVEVALEEEMLYLVRRFLDRIRLRMPEIIRLGSQPDNSLVDYGRDILESLTGTDMRNATTWCWQGTSCFAAWLKGRIR